MFVFIMLWFSKNKPAPLDRKDSATIRAEAMAHVRKARESLGEDTLERVAEALTRKQNTVTQQTKEHIQNIEADRVAKGILELLKDKK